jgi:hypothetical protein
MKKPNAKQIEAEIETLRTMKPTVLMESMFGDNHHDAIDAQIDVLANGLTEDDIYDIFVPLEEDPLKGCADNVRDAMLEAAQWVNGESEDGAPSKNWECLVRK